MNIRLTLATALLLSVTPAGNALAQSKAQAGATAQAGGQSSGQSSVQTSGKMKVVSTTSVNGDDGDQSVIEVRIDNGNVSVKRNGKEVPQDQIRREDDGRIIILDENGQPLKDVNLFGGGNGQNGAFRFRAFNGGGGEGQNNAFWVGGDEGEAPKVMIGVHMTEPGEALERHLHLKPGKCAMITGVLEGLPAEVAGLGEYDVIVSIDGSDIADAGTIRKVLGAKQPGDSCSLHVIQAGEPKDVKIKLLGYDAKKLGSAKLIGKEPDAMGGDMFNPLGGDMAINLKGLEGFPQLKDRVFVAPELGQLKEQWATIQPRIAELQPQIQKSIEEAMKKYQGAIKMHVAGDGENQGNAGDSDVEAQLDRLDKRLAQLEEMLGKLIDKQQPKQ